MTIVRASKPDTSVPANDWQQFQIDFSSKVPSGFRIVALAQVEVNTTCPIFYQSFDASTNIVTIKVRNVTSSALLTTVAVGALCVRSDSYYTPT